MRKEKIIYDWMSFFLGLVIIIAGSLVRDNLQCRFLTMLDIFSYLILASGAVLVIVSFIPDKTKTPES